MNQVAPTDAGEITIENALIEKAVRHSESFTYGAMRLTLPIKGVGMVPKFSSNAELRVGFLYSLRGTWEEYRGEKQFKVSRVIDERAPKSSDGLKKYLLSYESIGPVRADTIIKGLGDDVFAKIMENPVCLHEWVKPEIAAKIHDDLSSDPEKFKIKGELLSVGVSGTLIEKIFFYLGGNAIKTVRETPYDLLTIEGIGFKTADSIALKIGNVSLDDPERLRQIALNVADNLVEGESGDTIFTLETVKIKCKSALKTLNSFNVDFLMNRIHKMIEDGEFKSIAIKGKTYYQTASSYFDEKAIASNVVTRVGKVDPVDLEAIKNRLAMMSIDQIKAVEGLISERFSILTGGPGTGKSYITNSVKLAFKAAGLSVGLVAPTGKASAIIGGTTIHSALGWGRMGTWGPTCQIETDVLVVDESSMIDNELMLILLNHTNKNTRIVFVGDPNQLPPIGKGEPFKQFIRSAMVPVFELTTIHRQKGDSAIPYLAQQIKEGKKIDINDESVTIVADKAMERRSIERKEDDIEEKMPLELLTDKLVNTYLSMMVSAKQQGQNVGVADAMILVPYSSTKMKPNATEINNRIQQFRFKKKPELFIWDEKKKRLAIGDRVIRTKNRAIEFDVGGTSYTVYNANGDCGIVVGGGPDGVWIEYDRDDIPVKILVPKKEMHEIQLAYALTVHKAQGSQSRFVIVAAHSSNGFIFDRRSFYTSVTRASEGVIIVTPSLEDAWRLYKAKPEERKSLVSYRMKTFKKFQDGKQFVNIDAAQPGTVIGEAGGGVRKLNIEDDEKEEI